MAEKSKILFIGGTGYIGKSIVEASIKAGNPTFILVRESTVSDPVKGKLVESFKNSGATLVYGDLYDHESLVKAIKQVDVVISTAGLGQLGDQTKIIDAIKEAGNIKRFFPSEFGNDVDRSNAVEPAKTAFETKASVRRAIEAAGIPYTYVSSNCFAAYFLPSLPQPGAASPPRDKVVIFGDGNAKVEPAKIAFETKAAVRRAIEAAGIPYTYVSSNCFAAYFLPSLSQPRATSPPRDKVVIFGDGNAKVVYNVEADIGAFTIKAVDDPRTLNKILYIRPPSNTYSFNELVSLWEKKIGKTLEKIYVPEEQVLKNIAEAPFPVNIGLSISHAIFVKGDQTNFDIEPSFGVEASELYPDVKYTTVSEFLDQFV